jgi:secreted PhoX family phosphatase
MIAVNQNGPEAGRYLFTVFETSQSGVQRHDLTTGVTETIWQSPQNLGHVAFDASYWTPWGTYVTAEESWTDASGSTHPSIYGRLFEITNPLAPAASINFVHRNNVPRVSHEGIQWDSAGNMYFIDERNDSAIFRYTSRTPGLPTFFEAGQTSVLRVGAGGNEEASGPATWIPITDLDGNPLAGTLSITDANSVTSVDGRNTADLPALMTTDFDRPEDMQIQIRGDGDELLYFTTTTNNKVFAVNLTDSVVTEFVNRATVDAASGAAVDSAFTSPDNLALDAAGNLYVIEDQPGGSADIWFATDADFDGVAESIGRWATMSTLGAEPTGLYFDPFNANRAWVNVQHPTSGDDRTVEITAVPEPTTGVGLFAALMIVGGLRPRR